MIARTVKDAQHGGRLTHTTVSRPCPLGLGMGTARDLNDYPGRRACGTAGFNKQDIYARDFLRDMRSIYGSKQIGYWDGLIKDIELIQVGQVYDLDVIRPQFEDFKREVAKGA